MLICVSKVVLTDGTTLFWIIVKYESLFKERAMKLNCLVLRAMHTPWSTCENCWVPVPENKVLRSDFVMGRGARGEAELYGLGGLLQKINTNLVFLYIFSGFRISHPFKLTEKWIFFTNYEYCHCYSEKTETPQVIWPISVLNFYKKYNGWPW